MPTGGRRKSGNDGLFAIAASLDGLGDDPSSSAMTSAIEAVEEDERMSENEFAAAVEMFQEKNQIATAYLAIKNKKYRSFYLHKQLDNYQQKL